MQLIFDAIMSCFNWIMNFLTWIVLSVVELVANLVIVVINFLITLISILINIVLAVLPDSPFLNANMGNIPGIEYLGYLEFVIPFKFILDTFSIWLICMAVYFGLRILLKTGNVTE